MNNIDNYGVLLNGPDIKLQRQYFKEMTQLIGINAIYRAVKPTKHWTTYAEIEANYNQPLVVGCIFSENVDQRTMKKLGWIAELDQQLTLISVPYDLEDLQVGCIFIIPSGIDNAKGRVFRVARMSNIAIYPASITCALVPEYENIYEPSLSDHKIDSFSLLSEDQPQPQFVN